jgi:hypothetical protein
MLLPGRYRLLLLFAAIILGGCAGTGNELMPTPSIDHSPATRTDFDQVPPERRRSAIDLLCIQKDPEKTRDRAQGRSPHFRPWLNETFASAAPEACAH